MEKGRGTCQISGHSRTSFLGTGINLCGSSMWRGILRPVSLLFSHSPKNTLNTYKSFFRRNSEIDILPGDGLRRLWTARHGEPKDEEEEEDQIRGTYFGTDGTPFVPQKSIIGIGIVVTDRNQSYEEWTIGFLELAMQMLFLNHHQNNHQHRNHLKHNSHKF